MDPWDKLLSCVHVPKMYENYWTTMILSHISIRSNPIFGLNLSGLPKMRLKVVINPGLVPSKIELFIKSTSMGDSSYCSCWTTIILFLTYGKLCEVVRIVFLLCCSTRAPCALPDNVKGVSNTNLRVMKV